MKVCLVIPAKSKSTRLTNKNLQTINGKSLVRLACEKALACKNVHSVYLDTDSDLIRSQVSDLTDLKHIYRPSELASNDITANDLMVWALHTVEECDLLLQTFVTSPLISSETIDRCIEKFINSRSNHDSFFTVVPKQEYYWSEDCKPLNFDPGELPNSFVLPVTYEETHGLYGIYTSSLVKTKARVGAYPMLIPIPALEAIDIDNAEDFEIARRLIECT